MHDPDRPRCPSTPAGLDPTPASPPPATPAVPPRPPLALAACGCHAYLAVPYLTRFALVGTLIRSGIGSHRKVSAEILRRKKAGAVATDTPHSTYSISVLPLLLEGLFVRAFGRPIALWDGPEGCAYQGLTADGEAALTLTLEFLAGLDR